MATHMLALPSRRVLIAAFFAALVILLAAHAVLASVTPQSPDVRNALGGPAKEFLVVPFVNGPQGVTTVNSYSGPTAVAITGTGQASGTSLSDAFYVFTDYDGNPMEPWHPDEFYNFTLWINGGPADAYVNPIPPYNPRHIYVFIIDAPGGPLTFAVGDAGTFDNSGQYEIAVRALPRMPTDR